MITRLVVIALLASTPLPAAARADAQTGSPAARALWPHMHQCALTGAGRLAIKTKGTSAHRSADASTSGAWSRIDLHVTGAPAGSGGPVIVAHAINTKGTGTSGRMSSDHAINTKGTGANTGRAAAMTDRSPIAVDCVTSEVTGDAAAQKATLSSFAYMRADGGGLGWSCSVSGSEDKPVFRIGLLVPTILGQAERRGGHESDASAGKGAKGERWSGEASSVSIVRHAAAQTDSWHVACASKEPRNTSYDLAVIKKP